MKHLSILMLLAISALAHEHERDHIQPVVTPEPSTVILMGTGIATLVAWQWRKKRK